jgi:CHAT domain-containing protein/tetratricopeptide (TPR) repeat protein
MRVKPARALILGSLCIAALLLRPAAPPGAASLPPASGPAGGDVAHALEKADRRLREGHLRVAEEAYRQALALAQRIGDRPHQAAALLGLGDCASPHRPEKLALYERSLALSAGRQVERIRARVLFATGVRDADGGNVERARRRFLEAFGAARRAGDRRLEARLEVALGNVAGMQGDTPLSLEHYTTGLRLAAAVGDNQVLWIAAKNLGDVYVDRGESAAALASYDRALATARQLGDQTATANALNAMGAVYLGQADYARAHRSFEQALRLNPDDRIVAYALNNLGIVLSLQGEDRLALDYYSRSLAVLTRHLGDRSEACRVLVNIGLTYQGRSDYKRASESFFRALALAEQAGSAPPIPALWRSIGALREAQGRPTAARVAFLRSLAVAQQVDNKSDRAQALLGLARLDLASGRFAAATELADQAAVIAAECRERELFWQARTMTARALLRQGRQPAARAALDEAILTIEEVRIQAAGGELGRKSFLDSRLQPYRMMVELLARRGDAGGALDYAERAKARTLSDLVGSRAAGASAGEHTVQEDRLRERLAALNREAFIAGHTGGKPERLPDLSRRLHRARLDLEAFRNESVSSPPRLPVLAPGSTAWTAVSAADLASSMRTAFLEYVVTDRRTYLLTLVPRSGDAAPAVPRVYGIAISRQDLATSVDLLLRRLAERDLDAGSAARRLYELLLGPVRGELQSVTRLCIVPDGPLWNLPFQALEPAPGKSLLDRVALSYSPSLSLLAELRRRASGGPPRRLDRPDPGPLLAMGDPALRPSTADIPESARGLLLAPLPEAAQEVQEIARLYGPRSRVYTREAASEQLAKAQAGRFRVLHFATHSVLDDANPMYSYLVLSQAHPDPQEDGLLEAWEIVSLHLDADLVVLSACQTARGGLSQGEGVVGLSWAFLAAGARAIVASQWPVDSAATRHLMIELHRGLISGLPRAEALRRAGLATRAVEKYRHPYYWSGFVLLGDPG